MEGGGGVNQSGRFPDLTGFSILRASLSVGDLFKCIFQTDSDSTNNVFSAMCLSMSC